MKIIKESEVSTGNASGKAGISSIPFGRGFYQSGNSNGAFGIEFTPSGEPSFKTYKNMKHSKKNLRKKMKKFEEFNKNIKSDNLSELFDKIEKNLDKLFLYKTPDVSTVKQSVKETIKFYFKKPNLLEEDACATMGNTGGMGAMVSAQPSLTPGSVNASDSISGSGDIGQEFGTYMKSAPNLKKDRKKKLKNIKPFSNFKP